MLRILLLLAIVTASPLMGQSPTYGVGRSPTPEEIKTWDISIAPDGEELPPGEGTAVEGKEVYTRRCADCHGSEGQGDDQGEALVGGKGTLDSLEPVKTVGSYWPYATTLWDFINRAMPFDTPGSLTHEQVYAVVAYLLYLNGIIEEEELLNAQTLPRVRMPNREGFVPDPRPDVGSR
jgi:cytochrome c